ncbi:hypothetical protein GCM10023187_10040 [Nibrella viscosa]|uniref:Uncharacterized protein n=1 Tax=Nibrella viscosa TaxID=1084524 RepID=A0ABP8K0I3_9BACT
MSTAIVVSAAIVVSVDIIEVVSVVVVVSVDSDLFDWQAVARAIIDRTKKADFTMLFMIGGD